MTYRTTREKVESQKESDERWLNTAKHADLECNVPSYLQTEKNKYLKTVFQKNNMAKLKVIKRKDYYDLDKYSNNKNFVFYTPDDPPIEN